MSGGGFDGSVGDRCGGGVGGGANGGDGSGGGGHSSGYPIVTLHSARWIGFSSHWGPHTGH